MSVLRPTLNVLPDWVVVAFVVVDEELDFFEPQPAARSASAATSTANGMSLFTGPPRVLDCGAKTMADSTSHRVLAVAAKARAGRLDVTVRGVQRRRGESLEQALARAVDVGGLSHVEQLETRVLRDGTLATAYLGLARPDAELGTGDEIDADGRELVAAAQARLRAKLSYTNLGFALAPEVFTVSELREVYVAALGHDVSATNLQRVLLRRGVLERVDGLRAPGRTGGRPAALFRFASQRLEVTDEFAALRPPR
jgi:ADP-ribose pyrophosphatase YjhB (NUDIX family)